MKQRIETKLMRAFLPQALEIIDDSEKHAGHAGARPGGETHFTVRIVSDAFDGLSRVQRHQAVFGALKEELEDRVHALSIKALTVSEAD